MQSYIFLLITFVIQGKIVIETHDQFDAATDEVLREKQGAKWQRYGPDVLPCFVADMDYPIAKPIRDELARQVKLGDYGYGRRLAERALPEIYAGYAARRFGWKVDPGSVVGLVDIVQGIYLTALLFAKPNEGILTLTPTYPPLWRCAEDTGRRLVTCTMERGPERYEIDFDRLASVVDGTTRILLLCNPHNPTGRAFTRAELEGLADLALRYELTVLSDEIHADLVYAPHRHIPFAALSPEVERRTITMTSATKSFNIAGLRFAIAIFGSDALRAQFDSLPERVRGGLNSAGVAATEVAWRDCDDWLDALVAYLAANRDFLYERIAGQLPAMTLRKPEATFLSWLDCSNLGINGSPFEHFLHAGKVAFSDGDDFGDGGAGFVRLNFATSRAVLTKILDRVEAAVP